MDRPLGSNRGPVVRGFLNVSEYMDVVDVGRLNLDLLTGEKAKTIAIGVAVYIQRASVPFVRADYHTSV
jgi:hypothetical protein